MATHTISEKDIENLAALSRISLTEGEKKSLVKDIAGILAYVDQIKKAPIQSFEPQAGAVRNVMRDDAAVNTSPEDRERLLAEAPQREGDYIAVKKIIAQD